MRNVLRGTTIESWTGTNFVTSEDLKHNNIVIKESVTFSRSVRLTDKTKCATKKSKRNE